MPRLTSRILVLVTTAAIATIPAPWQRAFAAPPGEEQQDRHEASVAEATSTATLPLAVDLTAVDIRNEFAAMQTLHPQLVECCRDLERAISRLREIDGYTARWFRQVRIGGSLRDAEEVFIKIRHQPFSVFMEWADGSQQVWYVVGRHEDRLLARKSRGLGALRRIWRLPPESALAMKDSRYPVTQLGLLKLAQRVHAILTSQPQELPLRAQMSTAEESGRVLRRHVLEFPEAGEQDEYSRTEFCVDEETGLVVQIINHGWSDDGERTQLLEHYRYDDIQLNPGLTDDDFAPPQ